jgi:outer membrane protein assembly factor BamB
MGSKYLRAAATAAVVISAVFLVVHATAKSKGHDWPQFRGVNRDGVSPETGLADSWPEGGPPELWRVPLGEGYSGLSVVGDRIYTMFAADHDGKSVEFAAAFQVADGKEIWRTPLGERFDTEFGNGPSATPTVDGDIVYVLDSRGKFAALATADGAERWALSLTEDFGAEVPTFGFSMSALVDGDLLLVEAGGKEGKSMLGLDKRTGEVTWSIGDTPSTYNSPLVVHRGKDTRYVFVAQEKLMCINEKGTEIWSHDWPRGETHAMPVYIAPNRIYASGAEGVGARLIEVDEGSEPASVKEVWHNQFMRNHFSSAVLQDGHIFGFDNATLKAISVEDSQLAWAKRGMGKGSLILADGHLLVLSDRGKLTLAEATPEGYKEKGSVQALEGRCWTSPSLSNGRLFLRNHEEMVVYDVTR